MTRRPSYLLLSAAAWLVVQRRRGVDDRPSSPVWSSPGPSTDPCARAPPTAIAVDLALLLLFAVQHSVMARRPVKAWLRRRIPAELERTTYVARHRPVPRAAARASGSPGAGRSGTSEVLAAVVLWALFAVGWVLAIAATFAVDHLELLGLRQAGWAPARDDGPDDRPAGRWPVRRRPAPADDRACCWPSGRPRTWVPRTCSSPSPRPATSPSGSAFEERDLRRTFGASYDEYAARVPALVPGLRLPDRGRASAGRQQ